MFVSCVLTCLSSYCPFPWLFHFILSSCMLVSLLYRYLPLCPCFCSCLCGMAYRFIKFIICLWLIPFWHLISEVVFQWYEGGFHMALCPCYSASGLGHCYLVVSSIVVFCSMPSYSSIHLQSAIFSLQCYSWSQYKGNIFLQYLYLHLIGLSVCCCGKATVIITA